MFTPLEQKIKEKVDNIALYYQQTINVQKILTEIICIKKLENKIPSRAKIKWTE